jgi:uncharacterized protein YuzE
MRRSYLEVTFRKGKPIAAYLYLPRRSGVTVTRTIEIRPHVQVDYAATGEAVGIELTAPETIDIASLNQILGDVGAPLLDADDLRPLRAA